MLITFLPKSFLFSLPNKIINDSVIYVVPFHVYIHIYLLYYYFRMLIIPLSIDEKLISVRPT